MSLITDVDIQNIIDLLTIANIRKITSEELLAVLGSLDKLRDIFSIIEYIQLDVNSSNRPLLRIGPKESYEQA